MAMHVLSGAAGEAAVQTGSAGGAGAGMLNAAGGGWGLGLWVLGIAGIVGGGGMVCLQCRVGMCMGEDVGCVCHGPHPYRIYCLKN